MIGSSLLRCWQLGSLQTVHRFCRQQYPWYVQAALVEHDRWAGGKHHSTRKICTSNRMLILEDTQSKSLTVWKNVRELRRSPVAALSLGISRLIPLVSTPLYMMSAHCYMPHIASAQVVYSCSLGSLNAASSMGIIDSHVSIYSYCLL